jgi:hypothetical protein
MCYVINADTCLHSKNWKCQLSENQRIFLGIKYKPMCPDWQRGCPLYKCKFQPSRPPRPLRCGTGQTNSAQGGYQPAPPKKLGIPNGKSGETGAHGFTGMLHCGDGHILEYKDGLLVRYDNGQHDNIHLNEITIDHEAQTLTFNAWGKKRVLPFEFLEKLAVLHDDKKEHAVIVLLGDKVSVDGDSITIKPCKDGIDCMSYSVNYLVGNFERYRDKLQIEER